MSEPRFTDLALSDATLSALADMGYVTPTPVQSAALPMVATGVDLMVQSQTGTGKTAAFGIPVLEQLDDAGKGIGVLVLCPTRELARQVADEFDQLTKYRRLQTVAVYGGASLEKQVAEMRFARAVVGTPGRVLDHLRRKTLKLHGLRALILDEADEMLNMGFAQELNAIMDYVPTDRQTLLFSATIPPDIKRYAKRYMREPEFLSLIEENVAADDVEHHYYMVSGVGRTRDLVQVIEFENPDSAIIFTNTRKDSELVARYLKRQGYDAEYLNGDLAQRDRERVMQRSKDKTLRFLVATDIAARGIDISELSHVINFVLPESPEVYIHRTGRTGRAGAKGTAISLIGPREIGVYYYLKRIYNVALQERSVPTQAEIDLQREERRTQTLIEEIIATVGPIQDAALRDQTMRLLESDEAVEVVQALLKAYQDGGRRAPTKVGGVLADVPKPDRLAPGSLAQTLEGVADRVALVTSEYRGLPSTRRRPSKAERAEDLDQAPAAPSAAEAESAAKAAKPGARVAAQAAPPAAPSDEPEVEPVEIAPAAEPAPAAEATAPPAEAPRRARRTRSNPEARPQAQPPQAPPTDEAPAAKAAAEQAPVEADVPQEAASMAAPAERATPEFEPEAPRRRRRRRTKSTDASEAPAAAAPSPVPQAEPTRPSRSRRKPSDGAGQAAPAVEPAAVKAPVEVEVEVAPAAVEEAEPKPSKPAANARRLFVNLGRRDGYDEDGLIELMAELGGLLPEDFVAMDVRSRHAFADVVADFAEDLILAANGETVGSQTVRVEFAKDAI